MTEQKTRPSLIDIGLNLTHDSFDHDRKDVLQRALDLVAVQGAARVACVDYS